MGVFTYARARTVVLAMAGLVAVSGQAASAAPSGLKVDRDNIYQDGQKCDQRHPYALLPGGRLPCRRGPSIRKTAQTSTTASCCGR